MTQQKQESTNSKSKKITIDTSAANNNNNIMNLFQQFFQNNNVEENKNNFYMNLASKTESENYYNQFSPSSSTSTQIPDLQQNLNYMQMYFDEQQSSASSFLLNHAIAPNNNPPYDMLDYNSSLYSNPTSPIVADTKKQFKFRKNLTTDQKKQPAEPSLDALILTKYKIEQEILKRKRRNDELLRKEQQEKEELLLRNKKAKKPQTEDEEEDDDDDEEEEEEEPVVGDGAHSHSSTGSHTLSKDDKRKRNTAASARFRIKKKMREQALQKTATEMTEKANHMEQRMHELEKEIKWLRALVVEKNEAKIKQLIQERPLHSIAFPLNKDKE